MRFRPDFLPCARSPARCVPPALVALVLCAGSPASAQEEGHKLGGGSHVDRGPLQQLLEKHEEKPGHIYLAIPQMSRRGENTAYRPFCVPRIMVYNSSQETVDELIVGVRYTDAGRRPVGSTLSRFIRLKAGRQDDDDSYHDHLKVRSCEELAGEVQVVRCVYHAGHDCTTDVRVIDYGAVHLQLAAPATGTAPASPGRNLPPGANGSAAGADPHRHSPARNLPPGVTPKEKK